jgi:hypothetical protein
MQTCDFFAGESMEKRRAAAALIALARKKMNSGGKHWMKGAYHRMKVIVKGKPAESCYCMIGGLNAAGRELTEGRVHGDLALAKKMVASVIKGKEITNTTWRSHMRWGQLPATDIIISKNDAYMTTWQEVNSILKDAAAALRRKPRV